MRIYPCLTAGYFILFLMYAEIIFLYYFNDLKGSVMTGLSFCLSTMIGSIISRHFSEIWYGIGLVVGCFVGWSVAYARIRNIEKKSGYSYFLQWTFVEENQRYLPVAESI